MTTTQISQLYVSIFNRAVEGDGIIAWSTGIAIGKTQAELATLMLETDDAKNYFANSLDSDLDFVKHIYLNTLNKTYEDDKKGIDSWANSISNGTMTRGEAVQEIISAIADWSADGKYADLADEATKKAALQFNNRVEVSNYMATHIPVHSEDYATKTSFSADLPVTYDSSTVENAKSTITKLSLSKTITTISAISNASTYGVATLDANQSWDSSITTITYSFNTTIPNSYYDYGTELTQGFQPLNTTQQTAVNTAMQDASQYIATSFQEVSSSGLIRYSLVDMDAGTAGFSFSSGTDIGYAGDIFLNTDYNNTPEEYPLEVAGFGYTTILHELGHALGLKHPFEGASKLPTSQDDTNHTIMSYTSINNYVPKLSYTDTKIFIDYNKLEPYSYSLYDVQALQYLYGANTTTNIDNTTYTYNFSDYKLSTIWDAGGTDTIDLSNTTGKNTIDLRGGTLNSIDEKTLQEIITIYQNDANIHDKSQHNDWIAQTITDLYTSNNLYTGKNNLGIVQGTIIENLTTGSGNDIITDNQVDNIINSGAGDDAIYLGQGGYDTIDGGAGDDTIYLNILSSEASIITTADNTYIDTDNFVAKVIGVEHINFTDKILSL